MLKAAVAATNRAANDEALRSRNRRPQATSSWNFDRFWEKRCHKIVTTQERRPFGRR